MSDPTVAVLYVSSLPGKAWPKESTATVGDFTVNVKIASLQTQVSITFSTIPPSGVTDWKIQCTLVSEKYLLDPKTVKLKPSTPKASRKLVPDLTSVSEPSADGKRIQFKFELTVRPPIDDTTFRTTTPMTTQLKIDNFADVPSPHSISVHNSSDSDVRLEFARRPNDPAATMDFTLIIKKLTDVKDPIRAVLQLVPSVAKVGPVAG
jgi:hypothetical protein